MENQKIKKLPGLFPGQANEGSFISTYLIIGALFIMALFLGFVILFGVCSITGDSMNYTFKNNENILIFQHPFKVDVGDIVVISGDQRITQNGKIIDIIKRVVAVGGDTLRFEKAEILPNGRQAIALFRKPNQSTVFTRVSEPFLSDDMQMNFSILDGPPDFMLSLLNRDIFIPKRHVYVMGDNRNNSTDSRQYGAFARNRVIGKFCSRLEPERGFTKFLLWLYKSPNR
ncbi:MAG: signal peptidase I [Firmicutes bacterium]|nr:signal peptidase I [Bacillota bacterium]